MPIETLTKIGLISDALILCGEKPASSLTEDRYGVTVMANLFELVYEEELQSNRWRFASAKYTLSQLVDAPLNQWQYAYQLPAEMLLALHVYPPVPYEIYADHLYTNASSIEMDGLFKPEVSELPAYFGALMVHRLARDGIKALTESDTAAQLMASAYMQQRARALYADAQGRPATPLVHSPFTSGVGRTHRGG